MQPGRTTNNGGRTMEVKTTAPHCQLLLIVLMTVMLLPGMKGSPLLVWRKITRTIKLQESIGKGFPKDVFISRKQEDPGAPGSHHTTRSQEHPDTFITQAMRCDPGAQDAIGLGGPRCNQTILVQEDPEVTQTSLDQEIPEAPTIL
ncbi:hypothetical protein STEG23_036478 [Scotinomys teguina]